MPRPVLPKNEQKVRWKREAVDHAIERRVQAHLQAERIATYLPVLRAQRQELDDLIRDEVAAMEDLRKEASADRHRVLGKKPAAVA